MQAVIARATRGRPGRRVGGGLVRRRWLRGLALLLGLAAAAPGAARAQQAAAPGAEAAALPEELRAKLAEIEQETAKQGALAEEWAARSAEYEQAQLDAPRRLRAIERELETLRAAEAPRAPAGAGAAELETALLGAEQDLALARREATDVEAEAASRSERRRLLPELLTAARERLRTQGDAPPLAPGEDPRLADARRRLEQARQAATAREVEAYERELASYEVRGSLLERRIDRARLHAARDEARGLALRDALTAVQRREAERAAERARSLVEVAASLDPAVRGLVEGLAQRNATLAEQRTGADGLVVQIDDVSRKLAHAQASVAQVEADRARITRKIQAAGLSGSVGLLLRKQRADAPDVGKYRRFIRMRQELIGAAQERQMELREERREIADTEAAVARAISHVGAEVPPAERAAMESLLRDLLDTKRKYLDALISDYETYFQRLVDFDAIQQQLIVKTEDLLRFIDERILWIPSGGALRPEILDDARAALEWLASPRYWEQLGRALGDVGVGAPWRSAALLLALAAAATLAPRVRARIAVLGAEARRATCTSFEPTLAALGLTLLRVPWIPGAVALLAAWVGGSPEATQFARCVSGGVLVAAALWTAIEVPRQILRPEGIAVAHLGWPADVAASLRRALGRLALLVLPAALVVEIFELRGEDAWKESVGRVAFVLLFAAVAVFSHRVLRRPGGALARIADAPAWRGWRWPLFHGVAVAVPALLALGALGGWYWTALRLASRYQWTLGFLLALALALRLAYRWSGLARRRLALERERQRAEAARERAAGGAEGEAAAAVEAGDEPLDLAAVDAQTGRLLRGTALIAVLLGLSGIWAEVLPAAGILREVELWTATETVTTASRDAAGAIRSATEQRVVPITLADLLEAAVVVILALLLVRNLPGLLELSLFHRVGVGPGERYAYATIAKYGVGLGGLVLACGRIGIGWSSVQWLVAALGLGLGFGLQEIFANFVSGVILLFERPIRVGDTVTIGEQSGTVSKIRIRATWITGFDRKELVVPNKEFVTGRVVNWSLSDTVLRLEIAVGVAYGSDVEQALALLRRVAEQNELVLREPRPDAFFLRFGESTLDLELRCFSPDVASLLPIRHALHLAIDHAFREAGIEIAFPQRDLHLRTLPPGGLPGPAGA